MTTLTVSQLNRYIKAVLDEAAPLQNVYVSGEISNLKHYYSSGHMYFTIKDSSSQLKCVMFAADNARLRFTPENGMNVVCFGRVAVYERDGAYQLYVQSMQPKGVGELSVAYEQLKSSLEKKGWFSQEHKKPIPKYPQRIGVATSNMGAAVEDIKNIISRRFPICEIIIVPTAVQGEQAKFDIAKNIAVLDSMGLDTIIVGRGGGSLEDLWAFNTIEVAEAVYNCKTPIISAVGHETDYTICDFVSDLRAPTPSAAAEIAVPDAQKELSYLKDTRSYIDKCINNLILSCQQQIDSISHPILSDAESFFAPYEDKIESISELLNDYVAKKIEKSNVEFKGLVSLLNALSPLAVLSRGYSLTMLDEKPLTDTNEVTVGMNIRTKLKNGEIISKITEVL